MAKIGAIVVVIPLILVFLLYHAWAASILYGWLIIPLFPALPKITTFQFMGVMLFLSALRPKIDLKVDDRKPDPEKLAIALIAPLVAIAVGYIIKEMAF